MHRILVGIVLVCAVSFATLVSAQAEDTKGDAQAAAEELLQIMERLQEDPVQLKALREVLLGRIEAHAATASELAAREAELAKQSEELAARHAANRKQLEEIQKNVAETEASAAEVAKQLEEVRGTIQSREGARPALDRSLELIDAVFSTLPEEGAAETAVAETALANAAVAEAAAREIETPKTVIPEVIAPAATLSAEQKLFFEKQVFSTLSKNCFECHGPEQQKNGLRLDSLAGILSGGERGPAMLPGNPSESRMVAAIRREGELKMPPEKELDAESIAVLVKWIELGAPWPGGIETVVPQEAPVPPAPAVEKAVVAVAPAAAVTPSGIDFNRDIRPIFSNNCYACHGPDEKTREAGLRLDVEESAFAELKSGARAIVSGNREASEVYRRITTADKSDRMPPPDSDHELSDEQIARIGRWIDEGAPWAGHWSLIPPRRPAPKPVSQVDWAKNPIDNFVLARLEKEGLKPSPEADKRALIRRVTFDLTGLPPTPAEIEAFVNDASPTAYEEVVDRLLASPRYGEHMARYWLDLARYADTNGYHIDNERFMWRWRDWVIDSFNRNQPFDEFTVEQIAGDLLPNPTDEQLIATGFNRNHMINFEGGAIEEEYRVQYVIDRLDATSTVWMGMTTACAQCHDHKFDPISQREFYQMFAFFNSVPEEGLDGREGNSKPFIKAPLPEQEERMAELEAELAEIPAAMNAPMPEVDAAQAEWETEWGERLRSRWETVVPLDISAKEGTTLTRQEDGSILASGDNPDKEVYELVVETAAVGITAFRLEALTDESAAGAPGRAENGNFVMTEFEVEIAQKETPEVFVAAQFSFARADFEQDGYGVAQAIDGDISTGWAVQGNDRHENSTAIFALENPIGYSGGSILKIRMGHQSQSAKHNMARFRVAISTDETLTPARLGPWYVNGPFIAEDGNTAYETAYEPESGVDLQSTYEDGRSKWVKALPGYEDNQINRLYGDIAATYLYREIHANGARKLTLSLGSNDALKVWVNGEVVLDNNVQRGIERDQDRITVDLVKGPNNLLMKVVNYGNDYAFFFRRSDELVGGIPMPLEVAIARTPAERSEEEAAAVRDHFRRLNSPEWKALDERLAAVTQTRNDLDAQIPTTMIMAQMEEPRETFVLMRGQYDQPGEKVEARVPGALPPLPDDAPRDRLGFAQWLVSPEHPLTARVTVNRYWQRYFGRGIVETSEDFGAQGKWPTHPDLLDWLATEFVESGWDAKAMQRLIVTSAAYRQDSRIRPELLERDIENVLLARGPRLRLDAEMVRDNALALSGLLVEKVGGPSVKPYQPAGIWEEVAYGSSFTAQKFVKDEGDGLYRRSMYTFWKRQAPPPQMMLFDAPNRETCTARRARTNTPLQALALMNDPQYVEAARAFAERVIRECGGDTKARVDWAFQLATSRMPSDEERAVLMEVLDEQLAVYREREEDAAELIAVGDSKPQAGVGAVELAAWSTVTSMILNLDETITKG